MLRCLAGWVELWQWQMYSVGDSYRPRADRQMTNAALCGKFVAQRKNRPTAAPC